MYSYAGLKIGRNNQSHLPSGGDVWIKKVYLQFCDCQGSISCKSYCYSVQHLSCDFQVQNTLLVTTGIIAKGNVHNQWSHYVALEKILTLYSSGQENCVQKFGNPYQWKEVEKQTLHCKSTFTTKLIKWFSENKMFFTNDVCFLSTYLRMFRYRLCHVLLEMCWDQGPFFAYVVHIASMILHNIMHKFA